METEDAVDSQFAIAVNAAIAGLFCDLNIGKSAFTEKTLGKTLEAVLPMYGEERYSRGRKGGLFMENSEPGNTENLDRTGFKP